CRSRHPAPRESAPEPHRSHPKPSSIAPALGTGSASALASHHTAASIRSVVSTSPKRVTALASSTRTWIDRPTSRWCPSKTTIRSHDVRPVNWSTPSHPSRRVVDRLRPSTRTVTSRPMNSRLSCKLMAVCTARRSLFRRFFTSSATSSGNSSSAFVPRRGLYLKMKLFLNLARFTHPSEHVFIETNRIHPLHSPEYPVAPTLRGNVDVSGSHGKIADGLQQVVGHIVGEAGDELDPLDAGQRADAGEQVGKP